MSDAKTKVVRLDYMEPYAAHKALVALRDNKVGVDDLRIQTRAFEFRFGNAKVRDTFIDALNVKNGRKPGAIVVTGVELKKDEDAQPKKEPEADAKRAANDTK